MKDREDYARGIGHEEVCDRSGQLKDEEKRTMRAREPELNDTVPVQNTDALEAAAGKMFSEIKKEPCRGARACGLPGDQVHAGKRTVRREQQVKVLFCLMEDKQKAVIRALDNLVHLRPGKDVGKLIHDL
jgi:hypothetical protein